MDLYHNYRFVVNEVKHQNHYVLSIISYLPPPKSNTKLHFWKTLASPEALALEDANNTLAELTSLIPANLNPANGIPDPSRHNYIYPKDHT